MLHIFNSLYYTVTIQCLQGVFKIDGTFAIKTILQNFKHSPLQSSPLYWRYTVPNFSFVVGILPGTHFLWWRSVLLSHFPESPRVQKKRLNFLNSAPTNKEGTLRLLSAPSGGFWQQTAICPVSLWALVVDLHPLNWKRAQAVRRNNPTNSLCTCSVQRM